MDELADLAECVHRFRQERPEDVEGMRWHGVNTDPGVDAEFFADTSIKSNFICSLGYGTDENLFPRNPRLTFEEAGRLA